MHLVFILYALFASVFTVSKWGLASASPLFFVGVRMALAGLILLGYLFIFKRAQFKLKKEHLLTFVALALFNIYLTNILEFWGLQLLTSFKTCFIYSLSPFVSALFSFFIFSERLSQKKWLGLLIGIVGIMPALLTQTTAEERSGHFLLFSWAELSVMGAACCSVLGWIFLKQLVDKNGYSPLMANGFSMFLGGLFALSHSYAIESWDPVPVTEYATFLACTLYLILTSSLICYNLYGYLLKRYTATFISLAGLSTPLFTAFFGALFLGEVVTWPFALSMAILSAGLFLFHQEELAPVQKASV